MSILKRQVNSSSDFSSFFSVITYKSSVSLQLMHFLLWTKGTNQSADFLDFLVLGSKLTKFLSFLRQNLNFSSNFAPLFDIMRHISSILSLAEILYTFSKSNLSKYKFGEISPEQSKVVGSFCKNHIKFQLKKVHKAYLA